MPTERDGQPAGLPLRRLGELWPKRAAGAAFLTTFTFDASFFEAVLLGRLLDAEAHPVVVFADRATGYAAALHSLCALHACGRDYRLVAFDASPGSFHPKVHLLHGAGVALVGSGNLTRGGTGANLEAFDRVERQSEPRAFGQIVSFFRALVRDPRASLDAGSRAELSRLLPESVPGVGGDCTFLHSLGGKLKPQLEAELLEDHRTEVVLAAPFHDPDHGAAMHLVRIVCGGAQATVRIAGDSKSDPAPAPAGWISGEFDDGRPLHAKIAHAIGAGSSALVVGSPNLTSAAWLGENVEAIVVRQSLAALAFDGFVGAKRFRRREWMGVPPAKDREPPSLPPVPLQWALLDSLRLTVALADANLSGLRFSLIERDRIATVDLARAGGSEWTGLLASEPDGVAAVRVEADGFAPAFAFVAQEASLRVQPRLARIQRAIRRIGKAPLGAEERSDLLASIADLVEAVGAEAPPLRGAEAEPPGTGAPPAPVAPAGEDDPIRFVDDTIVQPPPGALIPVGGVRRLREIIDAALLESRGVPNDTHKLPNRWRPPVDGVEGELGRDADVDAPLADDDEARIEDALAIAGLARKVLPGLLARSRERAVTVYEVALRVLVNVTHTAPARARELGERAVEWIDDAWGVASWPEEKRGWALEGKPYPEPAESERALLEVLDKVLAVGADAEPVLDKARLALLGLFEHHTSAALDPSLEELRERLARRRNLSEQAEAIVAPLLAMDAAAALRAQLREELREHEARVRELEALLARYGKRSQTHKASAAEIARLAPQLGVCREKVQAAEASFAERERRVRDAPIAPTVPGETSLMERWRAARPNRAGRRVHVPDGDVCTACHKRLPAIKAQLLGDPRAVVHCPCGVLLARGPRRANG